MGSTYPPYRGLRVRLVDAVGRLPAAVAGRLRQCRGQDPYLCDESLSLRLAALDGEAAADGDWISGRLSRTADGRARLERVVVHALRRGASPDAGLPDRLGLLRRRAAILDAARRYFRDRDFLEVSTPARVICPGLEPHLVAFPAGGGRRLITSPELHLKRLLAAGAERTVEFARAFRDEENGRWHRSEFTMLEWYRAFADLEEIEADCERLVTACAASPGVYRRTALPDCDLTPPFDRSTVREALGEASGLDLAALADREALATAVRGRGHRVTADDDWDDLFFRIWLAEVEPGLGRKRPIFVHDYPASQAALARTRHDSHGEVAERFELYIDGVEVANAFHELNDPGEQRRRHEADRAVRRRKGRDVYPLDESFLAALESGMPPASGIALGLDRLVALLLGARSLDDVTAF